MILTPKETVEQYINASISKTKMPYTHVLSKGILSGMMIALGAACSNVAAHSIDNVGIARLLAGVVFPVGLMMVIFMGAELFTGDCLMVMAVNDKKITFLQFIRTMLFVYVGNILGGVILSVLIFCSGQLNYSSGRLGAYTIKVALCKSTLTPVQGITSGILCNILVCAAVLIAMSCKDGAGKLLASFFVILPFVTGGFEHCVANVYYLTAGLLSKCNSDYVSTAKEIYGISDISRLFFKNIVLNNMIPVTLGNIIGGSLFVGIPMFYLNYKNRK